MGRFQAKPAWVKVVIIGAFLVVPVVLPFAGPRLGIEEGGKISLNYLQSLYALVSIELAVAVYLWGVGKWSRFEPPAPDAGGSGQGQGGPAGAGQGTVGDNAAKGGQ